MIINAPQFTDLPRLRQLWMEAFGDGQEFWFHFIHKAKPLCRCRCVWADDTLAAALYWFDCSWSGRKLAYLYGVATGKAFRGRGICRALMEDTRGYLKGLGYDGIVLVPAQPELFEMYEKLGYRTCTYVREFDVAAADPVVLKQLTAEEYAARRRAYLPRDGVVQEGKTLDLLAAQARFYEGESCLAVCTVWDGKLMLSELLGEQAAAGGIVAALGFSQGRVRVPGEEKPFAMYRSLTGDPAAPAYFGLAMD